MNGPAREAEEQRHNHHRKRHTQDEVSAGNGAPVSMTSGTENAASTEIGPHPNRPMAMNSLSHAAAISETLGGDLWSDEKPHPMKRNLTTVMSKVECHSKHHERCPQAPGLSCKCQRTLHPRGQTRSTQG